MKCSFYVDNEKLEEINSDVCHKYKPWDTIRIKNVKYVMQGIQTSYGTGFYMSVTLRRYDELIDNNMVIM